MTGALLTTLFFAFTTLCATRAAFLLGSVRANLFRITAALCILGLWAHFFGGGLDGRFTLFYISGLAGFGLGGVSMFQALPRLGSSLSSLLVECGSALFAASIAWIWLGDVMTAVQVFCVAIILFGVVVGVAPRTQKHIPPRRLAVGVCWTVMASLGQGLGLVISRMAFKELKLSGISIDGATAAYQRLYGGFTIALMVFLLTLAFPVLNKYLCRHPQAENIPFKNLPTALGQNPYFWVSLNTLLGPVLGVTCLQWAIAVTGNPGIVQSIVATAPLVIIPFAYYMENSRPTLPYYIGAVLAISGFAGLLLLG